MQPTYHYSTDESKEFFLDEGCFILEVMNSETEPELSISRARVAPNAATEQHLLQDMKEWYYILTGSGEMHVGESIFPVGPGQVVAIPANHVQWIKNTGEDDLVFLCICAPRWKPGAYTSI